MIFFIICSVLSTVLAIMLCTFSGEQQRKEDDYLRRQEEQIRRDNSEKAKAERRDWDILNNWDDEK